MCDHPRDGLEHIGTWKYFCTACGEVLTARQVGLNPRARARNKWALRNWKKKRRLKEEYYYGQQD